MVSMLALMKDLLFQMFLLLTMMVKNDEFKILNLPDNGAELIVTNRNGTGCL